MLGEIIGLGLVGLASHRDRPKWVREVRPIPSRTPHIYTYALAAQAAKALKRADRAIEADDENGALRFIHLAETYLMQIPDLDSRTGRPWEYRAPRRSYLVYDDPQEPRYVPPVPGAPRGGILEARVLRLFRMVTKKFERRFGVPLAVRSGGR